MVRKKRIRKIEFYHTEKLVKQVGTCTMRIT